MPFKPDSSFFRKIVIGAVGTKAVCDDLAPHGYDLVELERGATDTKIWKDVKRKRVRIPDLVCKNTGVRIESRAKTKRKLEMSHSPDEAERAWDYGMVDQDWIAFPICISQDDDDWSQGELEDGNSYFHQRKWEQFECVGVINYFPVGEFREVSHSRGRRKGVVEASEYSIEWDANLSTRTGPVRSIRYEPQDGQYKICIENSDGRGYTWGVDDALEVLVTEGQLVRKHQAFAAAVEPVYPAQQKPPPLESEQIYDRFLDSNERTMRFTGIKLARLRDDEVHESHIHDLAADREEDLYVRLEALSYLAAVAGEPVDSLFDEYLNSGVDQDALESVICIGEVDTAEAVDVLSDVLNDPERPYFLRSAAAWTLGHSDRSKAQETLIRAFADQQFAIREEALHGLVSLGANAVPQLLDGLRSDEDAVAAGSAEALRRFQDLSDEQLGEILSDLQGDDPSHWAVWLIGNLPESSTATKLRAMQDIAPKVHYSLSLLWSFSRSWISRHWEKHPHPHLIPVF